MDMGDDLIRVEPYWYNEKDCLGTGSFGDVYKGHNDQDKNQLLAIKRIRKGKLPQHIIDQEIQILQELSAPDVQHVNFVTLLDCVQTERHVYLVMEYCNGGDLDHYLKEKKKMDEAAIKIFLQQIASALKILHDHKVVHRDLKPANILLSHNGSRDISHITFKIADFGMGRFLEEGVSAQTFCGTPVFMAPEIFVPNAKYDYKADLWSIGAIVFNCYTGSLHSAFQKDPIKFPLYTNPDLRDLLTRLLCNDPTQRLSFNDFYYHQFIGLKEIEETNRLKNCQTGATAARSTSTSSDENSQSGMTWLRRVFSIRRKSGRDDKEKILGDGHAASSNPSSPSQPLSPRGRGGVRNPDVKPYSGESSPRRPLSPQGPSEPSPGRKNPPTNGPAPAANAPSPKKGGGFFAAFFRPNSPPLNPIQEAISTQLTKTLVIENRDVYGIAHLDMRFYVLCRSPNILVQHSDQSPFIKIKDIDISKHVMLPQDVTACSISKCLYVTDIGNNSIWKVELGYPSKVTKWVSDVSSPHTASVNTRNGQVTTFGNQSKNLHVYGPKAELLYNISMPSDIKYPQHAVETSKGNFIVSFGDLKGKKHGVCEVSQKGKILNRYEHKLEKLNHPTHLAIDADDKVFVADNINNRVLQLDNRLKFEQTIPSDEKDKLEKPFRLCYTLTKDQKRLLVEHRINTVGIFNVS